MLVIDWRSAEGSSLPLIVRRKSGAKRSAAVAMSAHDLARLRVAEGELRHEQVPAHRERAWIVDAVQDGDRPPRHGVRVDLRGDAAQRLTLHDDVHLAVVGRLALDLLR